MKRSLIALLLVFVMVFTGLQGCSKSKSKSTAENKVAENNISKEQSKEQSGDDKAAMGRYMEKSMELPKFKDGERIIKIIQNTDQVIEIFTKLSKHGKVTYFCYQMKEDMTWVGSEPGWLNDGKLGGKNIEIYDLSCGQDGNYYISYTDYDIDPKSRILMSDSTGKTAKTVKIPYLEESTGTSGDMKLYPRIQNINALKNGNLVLYEYGIDNLLIFTNDGKKVDSVEIGQQEQSAYYITVGNNIITANEENNAVIIYNTETKNIERTMQGDISTDGTAYAQKSDGTILMGNRKGICRITTKGTLWETIVDGGLNSMSMPSFYIDKLFVTEGEEEEYYVAYMDNDTGFQLKHYVFDKNVSSVPKDEITVYSLMENNTIRQAISLFQAENADVKVNYVVAMGEEGGNISDYIRALNTELLAKNGADVLVLDGLPVASYLEKGVLSDISDIVNPLEKSGKLFTNITNGFKTDNKIYQMPIRVSIPIMAAKADALSSIKDMDSVINNIENSKLPYFDTMTYKDLLENCLALYSNGIFENGVLSQDKLTAFLENVKKVADNIKATEFDENNTEATATTDGLYDNRRLFRTNLFSFAYNECTAALDQVYDYVSASMVLAAAKHNDATYSTTNQTFTPNGLIGLNSASKEKEIAGKFISFLLSTEVQKTNLYDGFPVNTEAMKAWTAEESDSSFGSSDREGHELSFEWPAKKEREEFAKLLEQVKTPVIMNQVINNMIINEALPYLKGEIDANQAAAAANTKINTYLAE